ncbi:hypothetical protein FA13DRAFT_1122238 [Coprinellus micaceus]|uniref:F-box domain-containing protein n=1 Tax=Coprinellus micaceus TaxID=71717 RepID=A0A4Y7SVP7_COPMI|nr:hypothetical protein FA13DRAFT_1122238 [Coprinellus micaceus]
MASPDIEEHHPPIITGTNPLTSNLSDVGHLPVEILLQIFTLHSASLMRAPGASQNRRSLARIWIAHVCQRWREIALEENKLWSNLLFVTPEITELMLSRAGSAPLAITMGQVDSTSRAQALSDILSRHLHRVCSLEIGDIPYTQPDFLHLLTTPAPILETLALRSKYSGSQMPYRLLDCGNAPALKHLEIINFYIPLYSLLPIVPTLAYLHLGSKYSSSQGPPAEALLGSLKLLPLLETLILENYIPTDHYPFNAVENPVECLPLRKLSLRASSTPIHRLLGVIRVPNASLELVFTNRVGDEATAAETVSLIVKARKIQGRLALQELATRHLWPERYTSVLEFSFDREASGIGSDSSISVACVEAVHHSLAFWLPAFEEAFVELSTARSIRMESPHWGFPRRQWKHLGEKMAHVKAITFSPTSGTPGDLFMVLDEGLKSALPPFPSLSTLTAECGHILGRDREALASALRNRPDSHRVGTLRVTYSDNKVSRANISALEETVPGLKVEWVNECSKRGEDESDE